MALRRPIAIPDQNLSASPLFVRAAEKAIKPAINSLIKMKCKKIILGCTELPIAIFAFKSFQSVKSSKVFLVFEFFIKFLQE